MRPFSLKIVFLLTCVMLQSIVSAQLSVLNTTTPEDLARMLTGGGVTISNVRFTGDPKMAGIFYHTGGTSLNLDSGIVLTTGRARTERNMETGVNGNGLQTAQLTDADNSWALPGDDDLAQAISTSVSELFDACVLEFDFVPLGDSIKFNYVFSSEEYIPIYVCSFNDAFAFFISGPGITGLKNIALVPTTTIPVSIFNVNDVPGGACPNNPLYYVDNSGNTYLTHDGHTTVLTALEKVDPCKTYHLKLVISDVSDDQVDSGVFLQAKSLSSNAVGITPVSLIDPSTRENYLVEGCGSGSFLVHRERNDANPLPVDLVYAGTAVNGTDVQLLPSSVIIPGGSVSTLVNIDPVTDGLSEGNELLKIYTISGCASNLASDSALVQLRDDGIMDIIPDTISVCRDKSVQLNAPPGFSGYSWNPSSTLSDHTLPDPVATPIKPLTVYTCIANTAACYVRDSIVVKWIQPYVKLFAGNDTVAVLNEPFQLHALDINNSGITQYQWTPDLFLNNAAIADPEATLTRDFRYVVTGITPDGCVAKDDIFIKVYKGPEIYVPTGFTPNNDGLNDRIGPLPVGIKEFHFFRVFNRWGQLIFSTSDPRKTWDGTFNGVLLSSGTFVWMAEAVDYKGNLVTRKGTVTIIR